MGDLGPPREGGVVVFGSPRDRHLDHWSPRGVGVKIPPIAEMAENPHSQRGLSAEEHDERLVTGWAAPTG